MNGSAEAISSNDYYPFGLNHINVGGKTGVPPVYSSAVTFENWKYNGKELEETGMYDYGARFYMPDIGRFGMYDPLAEKTMEPYAYVYNNPVRMIDPTGMEGEEASSDSGGGGGETGGGDGTTGCCSGDIAPNKPGGVNNPHVIEEVVLTAPGKAVENKSAGVSLSFNLPNISLSSSLFGLSSKSDWNNYNRSSSAFRKMTAETGADQVANQFYLMFGGMLAAPFAAGAYTALGAYGAAGTYIQTAISKGSIDVLTQYAAKGTVHIKQTGITAFIPGYKWGIGLNFINNNYNSYKVSNTWETVYNDFGKNTIKAGLSSVGGLGEFLKPGLSGNIPFQLLNQGVSNIGDAAIDKTSNQDY